VVPAVTGIGCAKVANCQPVEVSLVKVTLPRSVPVVVHSEPTCMPVLVEAL